MHIRLPIHLDPDTFSALKSRNFKIFLSGQFTAMNGVWIQRLANSWLVYSMTGSPFKLALIELLSNAPIFIAGLIAGAWLEKHDKRKTMLVTQTLTMLHAVIMAFLVYTGLIQYWHILLLSLYLGIVSAVDMPARQSSILLMVENRKTLKSALALQSMTFNLSRLIGPSIAGFIVAGFGEAACFMITSILYLPVIYMLYKIKFNEQVDINKTHSSMIKDIGEGLKYVKNFYPLRSMFIFLGIFGLFSYSYIVFFPVFAKDILQGSSKLLGFLLGFFGFGAMIGAFSVASVMKMRTIPLSIFKVSVLYSVFMILFAVSSNPVLSLLAVIPAGLGLVSTFIASNTLFQTISAVNMRSRVISLYTIVNLGFGPIGCFLAGVLMKHISPQATLILWCLIMLSASIYLFLSIKKINKNLESFWQDFEKI